MIQKKSEKQGHSLFKHLMHMILCCGLPILILFLLPFIGRYSPALSGVLAVIAPFICPIMMGGMLFMMFRNDKACCKEEKAVSQKAISIETKENEVER